MGRHLGRTWNKVEPRVLTCNPFACAVGVGRLSFKGPSHTRRAAGVVPSFFCVVTLRGLGARWAPRSFDGAPVGNWLVVLAIIAVGASATPNWAKCIGAISRAMVGIPGAPGSTVNFVVTPIRFCTFHRID